MIVLYPTDLSEASAHAADWAAAMARQYHADITALHVVRPITIHEEPLADNEKERLRFEVASRFSVVPDQKREPAILIDTGQPATRILERAASLPADFIVMGTHGAGGFERLVLGSVTEKVLRKATCPVLTVPPRAHATSRLPFERILCAVDFSDCSLAAARFAFSLVEPSAAALTLVHVIEWPWEEPPPPTIEELPPEQGRALAEFRRYCEQSARTRLESLVPDSVRASRTVAVHVRNGKPYVQILQAAADDRTDLIVIGLHGRNPVDMALFGSTTNQIVRQATCPVLTLRQ